MDRETCQLKYHFRLYKNIKDQAVEGIRMNLYRLPKPFNYTRSKPPNYTTETRKLYNCMKPFSYTSVKTTKLHTKTTKLYKIAVQNPEAIQLKPQNYTKKFETHNLYKIENANF